MGVQYINREKYGGRDATGENITVTFKGEQRQLNSVLAELEIDYVTELPEEIVDKTIGMEHTVAVEKDLNAYADDIIASYMHLEGGRYVTNEFTTITYNGQNVEYLTVGADKYTDNNGNQFTFLDKYDWKVTIDETHIDFYIGDKTAGKWIQLADWEEVVRQFVNKESLGTPGGVATLDANGQLPINQMPTNSQIYAGEWDASSGNAPSTPSRSGVYYNISVEGTIDDVHYNVNDWIIWDGTKWNKQVQTADVSSVDGRKGAVNLEDKYAQLNAENTFTEVCTFENGAVSNSDINLNDNNINNVSYIYTTNVQVNNTGGSLYLGDEDGANVYIGNTITDSKTVIKGNTLSFSHSQSNPIIGIDNTEEYQFNGGDLLSFFDNLPSTSKNNVYFCRCRGTCTNTPYGSGDCDFHATVHKIASDNNWIYVEMRDIRSEWGWNWSISKVNGAWKTWMRNANIGDIPTNLSQLNNNIQAVTGSWDGSVLQLYTH